MSWTDEFIKSLKEWDEDTPNKSYTINDIVAYLGLTIGAKMKMEVDDWSLDYLKERVTYLVNSESIKEQFLVEGLIGKMSEHLSSFNDKRGDHIISEENIIKKFESEQHKIPQVVFDRMERFKSDSDVINSEFALSNWKTVIAVNFSLVNQRMLFNEELSRNFEQHKKYFDSLPEEDRDKTFGELRRKFADE